MIANLKPYPEYKDSGLPWLGQVPGHWELRRLRASITDCVNGIWGADPNGRDDLLCVRVADFDRVNLRTSLRKKTVRAIPLSVRSRRLLKRGDLLLEKSGGGELQPVGAVVAFDHDEPAVCSNFVARMPLAAGYDTFYINYLHSALYAYRINVRSIKQTTGIQNLDGKAYLAETVAFPPPAEQAAIVRFLDHMNNKIERAIRAKQKMVKLLNEQKEAIIHRAVTRGLDNSVKLKDSGIPWLGEIPEHWELAPNRAFLRIRKNLVGERHPAFTLLSLTKRGVIVRDLSEMRGKFSSDMGTSQEVRPGDLVFCLFDVPETPRTIGLSRHAGMITGAYTVMECNRPDIARFLELFYIAMDDRKLLSPLYSGLRNTIPKERFLGTKTPIPPAGEMASILNAVQDQTASLDTNISRLEREITLLREYRTRLVADVVTGKLDVRAAAADLPEQAEPLPADDAPPDEAEDGETMENEE